MLILQKIFFAESANNIGISQRKGAVFLLLVLYVNCPSLTAAMEKISRALPVTPLQNTKVCLKFVYRTASVVGVYTGHHNG